jgi:Peptidase family M23
MIRKAALLSLLLTAPATAQEIRLGLPVACEIGHTCFIQHYVDRDPSPAAKDYQCGTVTYDGHDGVDFRVPTKAAMRAGVDVVAAAAGKVLRTRDGVEDVSITGRGRASVENTECGNGALVDHGSGWQTQYCHMAKGSIRVRSGDVLKAGDKIGQIGLSGMTEFPHLHFTVRKDGKVIDPFKPVAAKEQGCERLVETPSLWDPSLQSTLSYRPGAVLNAGFADGPVTMEAIESGEAGRTSPGQEAPALVAFVRAIALQGGDVQELALTAPDGRALAENRAPPLDRDKAQWMIFSGLKRPAAGWPAGEYRARYRVLRDGKPAIEKVFSLHLTR